MARPSSSTWEGPSDVGAPVRRVVPLTTEQQAVVTGNLGLAFHAVGKLARTRRDIPSDEALSIAFVALCRASKTYQSRRKVKFSTWFHWELRGVVSKYDRYMVPSGYRYTADEPPRILPVCGNMLGRLIDQRHHWTA